MDDIVGFFKSGFNRTIVGRNGTIEVYNMEGVLQNTYQNTTTLNANYDGFVRIKNNANSIGMAGMELSNIKASDFANFNLTGTFSVYDSNFADNLENLVSWLPNINELNIYNTDVFGNLDSIVNSDGTLKFKNLTYLNISDCHITCKRSTINKVVAVLGSKFLYSRTIIIEDL